MFKRLIASFLCVTFLFSNLQYVNAQDFSVNKLPVPGTMVGESVPFAPLALKGLIVNLQKPLEFQFILDTGKGPQDQASIKEEADQLIKYFLAGLTIPEGDLWVNLSPYEKNRMVPEALGQTDLGRDLLAQDYILKQLTASLIYPERDLGKEFWKRVYSKAQAQFGTTNIPVNTFNKVWILPDQAQVYENGASVYVTKATLKVMLDEDYLALQKHLGISSHALANQIIRQIILPEITKEVNTGKNFAPLRQIYQAMILAKWYKETIQNSLLEAVYTNKNKIAGVDLKDPAIKEQIYDRYLKAYKKGAFNYIKDDPTPEGQVMTRKYFSGGTSFKEISLRKLPHTKAMVSEVKRLIFAGAVGFLLLTVSCSKTKDNQEIISQNQSPQAQQADQNITQEKSKRSEELFSSGLSDLKLGLIKEAVADFRESVKINPTNSQAWFSLGLTLLTTGQNSGAIEAYRKYIELVPDDPDAHNDLGEALLRTGQTEAAHKELEISKSLVIKLHPERKGKITPAMSNSQLKFASSDASMSPRAPGVMAAQGMPLNALRDPAIRDVFLQILRRNYDFRNLAEVFHLGPAPEKLTHKGVQYTIDEYADLILKFMMDRIDQDPFDVADEFRREFPNNAIPPELSKLIADYTNIKTDVFDMEVLKDALKKDSVVADIGAGKNSLGRAILAYSDKNGLGIKEVVGTDLNEWPDRDKETDPRLKYIVQDSGTQLPLPSNTFDTVIVKWVLHHMSSADQKELLKSIHRILKPGGKLIIFDALMATPDNKDILADFEKELQNPKTWPKGPVQDGRLKLTQDFLKLSLEQQLKVHALEDYFGHNFIFGRNAYMPQFFTYLSVDQLRNTTGEIGFNEDTQLRRVYGTMPIMTLGPPSLRMVFTKNEPKFVSEEERRQVENEIWSEGRLLDTLAASNNPLLTQEIAQDLTGHNIKTGIVSNEIYDRVRTLNKKNGNEYDEEDNVVGMEFTSFINERIPSEWLKQVKDNPEVFFELFPGRVECTQLDKKYPGLRLNGPIKTKLAIEKLYQTQKNGAKRFIIANMPGRSTVEQTITFLKFAGIPREKILIHPEPNPEVRRGWYTSLFGDYINEAHAIVFAPVHNTHKIAEVINNQIGNDKEPVKVESKEGTTYGYWINGKNGKKVLVINIRAIFGQSTEDFMDWLQTSEHEKLSKILFYGTSGGLTLNPANPIHVANVVIPNVVVLDSFKFLENSFRTDFDNFASQWKKQIENELILQPPSIEDLPTNVIAPNEGQPEVLNVTTSSVVSETKTMDDKWRSDQVTTSEMEMYYFVQGINRLRESGWKGEFGAVLRVTEVPGTKKSNALSFEERNTVKSHEREYAVDTIIGKLASKWIDPAMSFRTPPKTISLNKKESVYFPNLQPQRFVNVEITGNIGAPSRLMVDNHEIYQFKTIPQDDRTIMAYTWGQILIIKDGSKVSARVLNDQMQMFSVPLFGPSDINEEPELTLGDIPPAEWGSENPAWADHGGSVEGVGDFFLHSEGGIISAVLVTPTQRMPHFDLGERYKMYFGDSAMMATSGEIESARDSIKRKLDPKYSDLIRMEDINKVLAANRTSEDKGEGVFFVESAPHPKERIVQEGHDWFENYARKLGFDKVDHTLTGNPKKNYMRQEVDDDIAPHGFVIRSYSSADVEKEVESRLIIIPNDIIALANVFKSSEVFIDKEDTMGSFLERVLKDPRVRRSPHWILAIEQLLQQFGADGSFSGSFPVNNIAYKALVQMVHDWPKMERHTHVSMSISPERIWEGINKWSNDPNPLNSQKYRDVMDGLINIKYPKPEIRLAAKKFFKLAADNKRWTDTQFNEFKSILAPNDGLRDLWMEPLKTMFPDSSEFQDAFVDEVKEVIRKNFSDGITDLELRLNPFKPFDNQQISYENVDSYIKKLCAAAREVEAEMGPQYKAGFMLSFNRNQMSNEQWITNRWVEKFKILESLKNNRKSNEEFDRLRGIDISGPEPYEWEGNAELTEQAVTKEYHLEELKAEFVKLKAAGYKTTIHLGDFTARRPRGTPDADILKGHIAFIKAHLEALKGVINRIGHGRMLTPGKVLYKKPDGNWAWKLHEGTAQLLKEAKEQDIVIETAPEGLFKGGEMEDVKIFREYYPNYFWLQDKTLKIVFGTDGLERLHVDDGVARPESITLSEWLVRTMLALSSSKKPLPDRNRGVTINQIKDSVVDKTVIFPEQSKRLLPIYYHMEPYAYFYSHNRGDLGPMPTDGKAYIEPIISNLLDILSEYGKKFNDFDSDLMISPEIFFEDIASRLIEAGATQEQILRFYAKAVLYDGSNENLIPILNNAWRKLKDLRSKGVSTQNYETNVVLDVLDQFDRKIPGYPLDLNMAINFNQAVKYWHDGYELVIDTSTVEHPEPGTKVVVTKGKLRDSAMSQTPIFYTNRTLNSSVQNGGIDFNQINVLRNGKKINVRFDPAQLDQLEQGGFEGFSFKIESLKRISSPFQLLGLNTSEKQVKLAKA